MQELKRTRGRPPTGRKRNQNFRLAVTPEEKEMIISKSEKAGKTITDYIIDLVRQN